MQNDAPGQNARGVDVGSVTEHGGEDDWGVAVVVRGYIVIPSGL